VGIELMGGTGVVWGVRECFGEERGVVGGGGWRWS